MMVEFAYQIRRATHRLYDGKSASPTVCQGTFSTHGGLTNGNPQMPRAYCQFGDPSSDQDLLDFQVLQSARARGAHPRPE